MLVTDPRFVQARLVRVERGGEKPRLREQLHRAAIVVSVQSLDEQFLEALNTLPLPAKLVVEPQHLGDKARSQCKWRSVTGTNDLFGHGGRVGVARPGAQVAEPSPIRPIAREQALPAEHDVLVLQHPLYGDSSPALVKGWCSPRWP